MISIPDFLSIIKYVFAGCLAAAVVAVVVVVVVVARCEDVEPPPLLASETIKKPSSASLDCAGSVSYDRSSSAIMNTTSIRSSEYSYRDPRYYSSSSLGNAPLPKTLDGYGGMMHPDDGEGSRYNPVCPSL